VLPALGLAESLPWDSSVRSPASRHLRYFVGVVAIGFHLARRTHDSTDLFLAGRRLGWLPIGLSLFASNISSTTLIGAVDFDWPRVEAAVQPGQLDLFLPLSDPNLPWLGTLSAFPCWDSTSGGRTNSSSSGCSATAGTTSVDDVGRATWRDAGCSKPPPGNGVSLPTAGVCFAEDSVALADAWAVARL